MFYAARVKKICNKVRRRKFTSGNLKSEEGAKKNEDIADKFYENLKKYLFYSSPIIFFGVITTGVINDPYFRHIVESFSPTYGRNILLKQYILFLYSFCLIFS